jgi:hypothetical protein
MFVTHPIVTYSAVIAAAAATGVGFATVWSNPERRINRVFFTASLHVAVWLICRYLAIAEQDLQLKRVTMAVGTLMHFHLWLIKETVARSDERLFDKILRGRWWLLSGFSLAALCFTDFFIPTPVGGDELFVRRNGPGWYLYIVALVSSFLWLCVETVRQFRVQSGVSRLELQLLLFGGSATALVIIFLMAISATDASWIPLLVPFVVLVFYTATVVAVTTSRIFNARQIFFVVFQKLALVSIVSLAVYVADVLFNSIFSSPVTLLITVMLSLWLAAILSRWFDQRFQFYPQGHAARQAAYSAAQHERRGEDLERAFATILKGWGQTETAFIIVQEKKSTSFPESSPDVEDAIVPAMRQLKWATPERMALFEPETNWSDGRGRGGHTFGFNWSRSGSLASTVHLPADNAVDGAWLHYC